MGLQHDQRAYGFRSERNPMTSIERDAARLIEASLAVLTDSTFISSTNQVWLEDRLKTAQALLATTISNAGRQALVHVTQARNFVEAIEAPRLIECLHRALNALDDGSLTPRQGMSGLARGYPGEAGGAELPPEMVPAVPAVPAPTKKPAERGTGLVALGALIIVGLWWYGRPR